MPDLLVVVLELGGDEVRAALARVDRPGELVREAVAVRGELTSDVAAVLRDLALDQDEAARLLALAVAVGPDVEHGAAAGLLAALQDSAGELVDGWSLPPALPVVAARAGTWAAAGAAVTTRPLVAGAVVAAARSVGAHAHLPGG